MPKKIKVGSTAWIKKMAKARKAAAKERKKGGGKKKKMSRATLEKRITVLENKLDRTLGFSPEQSLMRSEQIERDETEYHKLKKERREMDLGDW